MRKLLLFMSLAIWGAISCVAGPDTEELGTTRSALSAPLPPIRDYTPTSSLPLSGYTHLVVSYCQDNGRFWAAGVDAYTHTVVFLLRGLDGALTPRFLGAAYGIGVPVTVYTAPIIVLSEEEAPTVGSSNTDPLPITGRYFPTCNGDVADPPPGGGVPQGDQQIERWNTFGDLALDTAEGLHQVGRAPPPPTRR
ncbi:hypothetical protein [Hyalangium versicolor]|uniref:hypothetical protein n=1 Tax=Hyalangium versicolor TaxID=2861190 RepID=UPI001CCD4CF5|nr:hypothetical protein [Hyalangium versicolor]